MRITEPVLLLAAGLLLPALAQGQTLQDSLAAVYNNNPSLLAARALLRAVDENVPQALSGWRPQVVIGGSFGYTGASQQSTTQQLNPATGLLTSRDVTTRLDRSPFSTTATITQPLFRGGRTVASTRRAENQVLGQRARLLAAEQQVLSDTVNAYVAVIRDQELLRLNTNNEQVLTEQLRATNERFRVGEITRTDVAQAESRLAGARSSRAQAEGNLQISRATFTRLVGTAPQRLVAPQPLRQPVPTAREAGLLASANNPNVVALLFDAAAAQDNIDLQISQLLPQLSLQGQGFSAAASALPNTQLNGGSVAAVLSLPLYQGGAEYALVRQARQQAQQQRQLVDDQRRTATQQATQAYETLQSARAQVESVRAQIRAAEIALDGVQREAIVGSRTTLDVLNAEQELLNARTSLVQALANVVSASYSLAAAVGRLTAQDLALPVTLYDARAYYNAVRDRWVGLGDYSPVAERR